MESQSELVGGDQNNQTVQPLVADENDQNVKSQADGNKKAKSPGKDKKCRAKKKLKTEDTERQLEETRSENDELKKKIAYLNGKVDQAKEDMELITGARYRVLIRPRAEPRKNETLPFEATGFGTGEIGLPLHYPPVHQFGTTMGSGDLAVEDSPGLPQSELSQRWTHLSMPSTPILENLSLPSTSFIGNLPMLSTSFVENDWIKDQYNAPTQMPKTGDSIIT